MGVDDSEQQDRESGLRRLHRWLLSPTDRSGPATPQQVRRDSWILTAVAVGMLVLMATDLPLRGWSDYARLAGAVVIACGAVRSWLSYRRLRSRPAQGSD